MAQQRLRHEIIEQAIIHALWYYGYFNYPLYEDQLFRYLPIPSIRKTFTMALAGMIAKKQLNYDPKSGLYTLRGHGIHAKRRHQRAVNSASKIAHGHYFAQLLGRLPFIYLVGLSGSCAMDNAKQSDDIDLVIISAPGCMWLSRITAIFLAKMLQRHRRRGQKNTRDLLCLNLFFDSADMLIPEGKQNIYGAHELMQMRPLFIRGRVYADFIAINKWAEIFLPQAYAESRKSGLASTAYTPSRMLNIYQMLNRLAKYFQLAIMGKRTREMVSDTQLWFFPQDFQLKLERKKVI